MKNYGFVIADVFTQTRFGGNQLAVFTSAAGLDTRTMQEIAREMNYSETTFLSPPQSRGDFQIRIFTPARELPFAGHPIVGSAYVAVSERLKSGGDEQVRIWFEAGAGLIGVDVDRGDGLTGRATMEQPLPIVKRTFEETSRLAAALSIEETAIKGTGLPVEAIYNGITVLITPVVSAAAVTAIEVDSGRLKQIASEVGAETILVFTRETVNRDSTVHCRVFAPSAGVLEDAATGSASGPLGYYLYRHALVAPSAAAEVRIVSEQGYEMNRPSRLEIELRLDAGTATVSGVRVGGGVVIAGRGELFV